MAVKAPPEPVVPARDAYRRRKRIDAARVLPFAGAFLFLLPVLWGDGAPLRSAWGGVYVFAVWAGMIAGAAFLSFLLRRGPGDDDHADG